MELEFQERSWNKTDINDNELGSTEPSVYILHETMMKWEKDIIKSYLIFHSFPHYLLQSSSMLTLAVSRRMETSTNCGIDFASLLCNPAVFFLLLKFISPLEIIFKISVNFFHNLLKVSFQESRKSLSIPLYHWIITSGFFLLESFFASGKSWVWM